MLDTALELFNNLLNTYKTQYDKLAKAQKKRIKVQNVSENLTVDLYSDEDNLPPIYSSEAKEKAKFRVRRNYCWMNKIKSPKKKEYSNRIKKLDSKKTTN